MAAITLVYNSTKYISRNVVSVLFLPHIFLQVGVEQLVFLQVGVEQLVFLQVGVEQLIP